MYGLSQDFMDGLQNYNAIFPPIEYITDSDRSNFFVDDRKFLEFLSTTLVSYDL